MRTLSVVALACALALAPAGLATAQTVQDCRDLLFVFVDERTCNQPDPCPHPDIAAADECLAAVLAGDPTNEEAHLFRALTRILRLADEQRDVGSNPPFTDSLKETLDQAAIENDPPEDHQTGGPNEAGRSVFDFTADLPRSDDPFYAGEADGSFSDFDSFAALNLDAGRYLVAVAPCCTSSSDVIDGVVPGGPFTIGDTGFGSVGTVRSEQGDFRLTFTGDVDQTVVDGTLTATLSPPTTTVEFVPFTVNSTGPVFIDVLSWEFTSDVSVPDGWIDVNGDGEALFADTQIFVFVDDGALDTEDRIGSNDDAPRGDPFELPPDAPTGGELQEALDTITVDNTNASESLTPAEALAASDQDLDAVGEDLVVVLTSDEVKAFRRLFVFDLLGVRQVSRFDLPDPVELDHGDVKFAQAVLNASRAALLIEQSTDLDFDLDELTPLVPILRVQDDLVDANPDLFTLRSGGAARLAEAKAATNDAIDDYFDASRTIRHEEDDQENDLVTIDDLAREADDRFQLAAIQRALSTESAFLCNGTGLSLDRLDELNDTLGTSFGPDGARLDLRAFFDPPFDGLLRPLLPPVEFDLDDQKNQIRDATVPDPTLGGLLLPASVDSDCDVDGVLDADDLSPLVPNGPELGSCIAGDAKQILEVCSADTDCGAGGQCSLDQEDRDEDGVADVDDNCLETPNPDQGDGDPATPVVADGFDFFDALGNGEGIEVGNPGPISGRGVRFACGPCLAADFSESTPRIGDGGDICGYSSQVPKRIVRNDDLLCARSESTGTLYEIDLLSVRVDDGCFDGDAGASCAAAGGETSYERTSRDGFGNACDCDFDQDRDCDPDDVPLDGPFFACFGTRVVDDPSCAPFDMNGDGGVGQPDYSRWLTSYGGSPGPSIRVPDSIPAAAPVAAPGSACGMGFELALTLPPLLWLRLRHRRRGARASRGV